MEPELISEEEARAHRARSLGEALRALDAEAKELFGPKAKVVLYAGGTTPVVGGNRRERRGIVRDARKGR